MKYILIWKKQETMQTHFELPGNFRIIVGFTIAASLRSNYASNPLNYRVYSVFFAETSNMHEDLGSSAVMKIKFSLVFIGSVLILLAGCNSGPVGGIHPTTTTAPLSLSTLSPTTPGNVSQATATPAAQPTAEAAEASPIPTTSPADTQQTPEAATAGSETPADSETPAGSPTPSSGGATPGGETSSASACIDKAAYYGDVNIPDDTLMQQGQSFTKTWRFRNEGTCTWDQTYSLVFAGGEVMNAPQAQPLSMVVAPGDIVEVSADLQTPQRGGTYRSLFEFQNPVGQRFGTGINGQELFWVQVAVGWIASGGTPPEGSTPPEGGTPGGGTPPEGSYSTCR